MNALSANDHLPGRRPEVEPEDLTVEVDGVPVTLRVVHHQHHLDWASAEVVAIDCELATSMVVGDDVVLAAADALGRRFVAERDCKTSAWAGVVRSDEGHPGLVLDFSNAWTSYMAPTTLGIWAASDGWPAQRATSCARLQLVGGAA